MNDFASVIVDKLKRDNNTRLRSNRLILVIEGPHNRRRKRVLERLEKETRAFLEERGYVVGNDWGTLEERDWESFFDAFLKFIAKLLPILLAFI